MLDFTQLPPDLQKIIKAEINDYENVDLLKEYQNGRKFTAKQAWVLMWVKAFLENSTNTVTANAGASDHVCTGLPGECLTCFWEAQKK